MDPLAGLPRAFTSLIGALSHGAEAFPAEALSTCGDCAMKPRPGVPEDAPWAPSFLSSARCCTYHPELANFLAGRALRRADAGSERVRARLALRQGVIPEGIRATPSYKGRYLESFGGGFGQDDDLRCPYWSESAAEGFGCTVHLDRDAVCRTWHCRIGGGARAHAAWMALKETLAAVEVTLANRCVAELGDVPDEDASPDAYERWFVRCADHVDRLDDAAIDALRGPNLDGLLDKLGAAIDAREAPMPEVLMPTVSDWAVHAHGVTLTSWSTYDPVEAPAWIFELLALLDGRTPWRHAKATLEARRGAPVGDDLFATLYRRGLLGPAQHVDVPPGMTILPTR